MIYLHISDLHIGEINPHQPGGWNAPTPAYTKYLEILKGQWGHHYLALQRLHEFYHGLLSSGEKVQLIMSGDATSFGKPVEFRVADAFLRGTLGSYGLGIKNWLDLAIPGNHDHWPGSGRIVGRPTAGLAKYFPRAKFPFWTQPAPLAPRHTLRFIAINTDADVRSYSSSRLHARGKFQSQLAYLDDHLPARSENEVRVLLLHHSMLFDRPGYGADLSMQPASAAALEQALVNHGIAVMMCGHTHVARVDRFVATAPNGLQQPVVECCCGTTTQRDRVPSGFQLPNGQFPNWRLEPNTLLVHKFDPTTGGGVALTSQAFVMTSTGFKPYGAATTFVVG